MRWFLLACILSFTSASAQDSAVAEKPSTPQAGQQVAPATRNEESTAAEKKSVREKARAIESNANPLLNVNPVTKEERELQDSLMTKVRSLNGGGEKAAAVVAVVADDGGSIMEDFKWPLIIIGGLLVYFLPTLLGMKRNEFKKVFLINLLGGCTVAGVLITMSFMPFPKPWLYGWAAVSWVLALVQLFLKDCAPPPERERRRHRSHSRSRR